MDYTRHYERLSRPFRSAGATRALNLADRALVFVFAASYVILLAVLALHADARLLKAILVPAVTFALVSALRAAIDEPRPYEACSIDPILEKDTRGKSLPSRHMTSATVIACTFFWIQPVCGGVLFAACAGIAFTRIVGGVHYPADVFAAVAIALACAGIGFVVVP